MLPLAEGENAVTVTVVDTSGREWERVVRVHKRTRWIHQTEERWRMAISLDGAELTTGICQRDGLKEGMKLLVYAGGSERVEELVILGDAKVREESSLAHIAEALKHEGAAMNPADWGVITR